MSTSRSPALVTGPRRVMDAAQLVLPQRVAGRRPESPLLVPWERWGPPSGRSGPWGSLQATCGPAPQGHTAPCYPGLSAQQWSCLCPKVAGQGGRRPREPDGCRGVAAGGGPLTSHAAALLTGGLSPPRTFCQHRLADHPACGGPREGSLSCAGLEGCLGGVRALSELEPRLCQAGGHTLHWPCAGAWEQGEGGGASAFLWKAC